MNYISKALLIDRLQDNYLSFQHSLSGVSRLTQFEMAGRISAVTEAYEYMTQTYEWDDEDEIEFFMKFRDPLTIIADLWHNTRGDLAGGLEGVIWDALNNSDDGILVNYPMANDAESLYLITV